jgi:putative transposase
LKYCPQWPSQGFASLDKACDWIKDFVSWYNHEHRHSRIKFVTPAQRHGGEDKGILEKRTTVYELARSRMPERWSGKTRNWSPVGAVAINNPAASYLAALGFATRSGVLNCQFKRLDV